jgi:hypothetical protein
MPTIPADGRDSSNKGYMTDQALFLQDFGRERGKAAKSGWGGVRGGDFLVVRSWRGIGDRAKYL